MIQILGSAKLCMLSAGGTKSPLLAPTKVPALMPSPMCTHDLFLGSFTGLLPTHASWMSASTLKLYRVTDNMMLYDVCLKMDQVDAHSAGNPSKPASQCRLM